MKNLPLFALLLSSFICASVSAQEIDSTFLISYPYKKQILNIGGPNVASISLLRLTGDDGTIKNYCRISTRTFSVKGWGNIYNTVLNKDQTEELLEKINKWYTEGESEKSTEYVEYVDLIRNKLTSLKMAYVRQSKTKPWILILDADRYLNRGRGEIKGLSEMQKLTSALEKCIPML
jgi:hypothetical protein